MNAIERLHLTAAALQGQRTLVATATVTDHYQRHPQLAHRYGPAGRAKCEADAAYHLSYLAEAVAGSSPALFVEYLGWAKVLLTSLGVPAHDLVENLESMRRALVQILPPELAAVACEYLDAGLQQLPGMPTDLGACIADTQPLGTLAHRYLQALLDGERERARQLVTRAVDDGHDVRDIYLEVFQRTQYEVGRLWQTNRISVAQEHYCTAATQLIMSSLYPRIFSSTKTGRTLVAVCVEGDLHEIGARIVADFFEMEGWDTFYLGANTPTRGVVEAVIRHAADVLGISATMTFHVRAVAEVIRTVRASEACRRVRILVGGYPFNVDRELWRRVGADGSAHDARAAVALANRLVDGGTRS